MASRKHLRISVKRAQEASAPADGQRLLVDRLWPRGQSKEALRLDGWLKELAPSTELRQWFGHEASKWDAFQKRYFRELDAQPEAVDALLERCRKGPVTLVYGAKDEAHNNAVALKIYLEGRQRGPKESS